MEEKNIPMDTEEKIPNTEKKIQTEEKKIPSEERKQHMRKQAISIFELSKGIPYNPEDNGMNSMLEMAGYVLELTN